MKPEERLIEYESMLHASVQRVGRAVRNLRQEMGGYSSTTPGNGSPGGGKGGRPVVSIDDPNDPVDPAGCDVPVTSVESQALFGRDEASADLVRLTESAVDLAAELERVLRVAVRDPGPSFRSRLGPDRIVVLGYARLRRLLDPPPGDLDDELIADLERPTSDVFHLCQKWGYDLHRAEVPKDRAEMLAVDLTGMWCTSHLRIGERRRRHRGELCQWCLKFEAVEGFIPPRDLVRIHVEFRRVRDDQIRPYRQAHRDRRRAKVRR